MSLNCYFCDEKSYFKQKGKLGDEFTKKFTVGGKPGISTLQLQKYNFIMNPEYELKRVIKSPQKVNVSTRITDRLKNDQIGHLITYCINTTTHSILPTVSP